jgi:hypothetical protein
MDLDGGFVIFDRRPDNGYNVTFCPAQPFTAGTVFGGITDESGDPEGNVQVQVTASNAPGYVATSATDAQGNYSVSGVPFGGGVHVAVIGRPELNAVRHVARGTSSVEIDVVPVEPVDKQPPP